MEEEQPNPSVQIQYPKPSCAQLKGNSVNIKENQTNFFAQLLNQEKLTTTATTMESELSLSGLTK